MKCWIDQCDNGGRTVAKSRRALSQEAAEVSILLSILPARNWVHPEELAWTVQVRDSAVKKVVDQSSCVPFWISEPIEK